MTIHPVLVSNAQITWLALAVGLVILIVILRYFFHLVHIVMRFALHGCVVLLALAGIWWLLHVLGVL
jgi:hypothetical protein